MNAQGYHRQLVALIGSIPAIVSSDISFREIDENECYIKAVLAFASGHALHLAEYVIVRGDRVTRPKYRYQLLTTENKPLARWDNAPHHKSVATFPDHWHDATDQAHPSRTMSPADAVAGSLALIEAG
ncbi:MAG: hypothetical protein HY327_00025 [Chloroflexi bacterium]|nr:hypothetical protein [Chloroflexota bacterium]